MDADRARTRRRRLVIRGMALLAAVLLVASVAAFLASSRGVDVDINSGREARTFSIGRFAVLREEYDTPFSKLVASAGAQRPPPEWRRFHTSWCPSGARINHRYGSIVNGTRNLLMAIEMLDGRIPPADQHRLAGRALELLQRSETFLVMTDSETLTIELVVDDKVVESYQGTPER